MLHVFQGLSLRIRVALFLTTPKFSAGQMFTGAERKRLARWPIIARRLRKACQPSHEACAAEDSLRREYLARRREEKLIAQASRELMDRSLSRPLSLATPSSGPAPRQPARVQRYSGLFGSRC